MSFLSPFDSTGAEINQQNREKKNERQANKIDWK